MEKQTDDLLFAIYRDGRVFRIDMSAGDMRSIGQQLMAMADNVVIPGTPPIEVMPEAVKDDVVTA